MNIVRVLVLCAKVGEGHVTVARSLVRALRAREGVDAVELRTDLDVLGPRLGRFLTNGFELHLDRIGWSYDLAYRVFFERAVPRRIAHWALAVLGRGGLARTIAGFGPDLVVADYPVLSAALGQLRALGRLGVPVCSAISDPAGLYYWAHPGIDLHVLSWPESLAEVERIAGSGSAVAVRPLVDARFFSPPSRDEARATLGLPLGPPVAVVSGGGWGVGDLVGATEATLAGCTDGVVLALAGRSRRTRARLEAAFGREPRAKIVGFTERMPEMLTAADVLIHTTGGTTALEARVTGCPFINYGRAVAHVRAHARFMAEAGVAEWASDRRALALALARTLARGRREPLAIDALPNAADVVVSHPRVSERGRKETSSSRSGSAWGTRGSLRCSSRTLGSRASAGSTGSQKVTSR